MGPTVCSTQWAGRLYASVTCARPVGSACPCRSMSSAHARRSCTPANVWMALSMQWCPGTQQPRSALFAALTMASASSVVMSPRHTESRASAGVGVSSAARAMPACAMRPRSNRSCTARNRPSAGRGSRVLTSARNSANASSKGRPSAGACARPRSSSRYRTRYATSSSRPRAPPAARASLTCTMEAPFVHLEYAPFRAAPQRPRTRQTRREARRHAKKNPAVMSR